MGLTILHTEWSRGWGGQEIRIVAESMAFMKRGYRVMLACQPDALIRSRAEEAGIPVIVFPQKKGLRPTTVLRAMHLIRDHGVNLVHTHSSVDAWNFGLAGRLAGVPVVRSRHLSTPISRSPLSYLLYMKLADRVITSGRAIKDEMVQRNRMRPEQLVSIPAGVDEKRFNPSVDPRPVMQEMGLIEDDFVVGIVAVLRIWKGHVYLIHAVAELARRGIPIKLLVVGEGPQQQNLRALIQKEGLESIVQMIGYRKDVPALMAAMDCLVLPSIENEATSQVLPQGMAMKRPVIASTAGGLTEVVINHETGLLVPPRDSSALRDAILWIYEHPAEAAQLAEHGYRHCLDQFTFERMIDRTEQVYRDVLRD